MSEVLFKRVETLDQVAACNESDIVFCEATGEVYTHSKRYGTPTITEIGDSNPNADIQMQEFIEPQPEVQSSPKMAKARSSAPVTESVVTPSIGDIYLNGKSYRPDEFTNSISISVSDVFGIYVSSDTIIETNNSLITEWGLVGVDIPYSKYSSLTDALKDMDGYKNSMILKSLGSVFSDYITNGWYIPSLGELDVVNGVKDTIQFSLAKLNSMSLGAPLLNSYYWSCTPGTNASSSWAYDMDKGKGQLGYRTSRLAVRRLRNV